MNQFYLEQMAKERQRETEAEAGRQRLLATYAAHNPSPVDRALFALGNTLIRLGEHLKRRCESPAELDPTPCRGR